MKLMEIIKKYQTIIKYVSVAISSFIVDITLFTIFNIIFHNIIYATIMARIISSLFNFFLNKKKVFASDANVWVSIFKYYLLVVIQMFLSAFSVDILNSILKISPTLIKIPVEFIIFIINYLVQKFFIFHK